ncbi:MAG: radical SAM family heme chaperone HemW [Bacteroides sp.]|nr:radical SAM family heme chaperone HemW [Bacteroides sp.]
MSSSLYIHVPYCRRRCIYCDFYSAGARQADWDRLAEALLNEFSLRRGELTGQLRTLYLGGGTPSMIPRRIMKRMMDGIFERMGAENVAENPEITLEINPEDVDEEAVGIWKEAGVNRVSVGLQSFSDEVLRRIGRLHSSAMSRDALETLVRNFDNVSGDLIFGLPGQTPEILKTDIDTLLGYSPQHVSVYSLMYEEHTALTVLRDSGRMEEASETDSGEMYRYISARLKDAGYRHYEISNYAKPGYESRHNSGYWTGRQYLGLGPSAHSYDGLRTRRANPADVRGYLAHFLDAGKRKEPFYTYETLTEEERLEERVMLALRMRDGIDLPAFSRDFGERALKSLLKKAVISMKAGLLVRDGDTLRLTDEGVMVADNVIVGLI